LLNTIYKWFLFSYQLFFHPILYKIQKIVNIYVLLAFRWTSKFGNSLLTLDSVSASSVIMMSGESSPSDLLGLARAMALMADMLFQRIMGYGIQWCHTWHSWLRVVIGVRIASASNGYLYNSSKGWKRVQINYVPFVSRNYMQAPWGTKSTCSHAYLYHIMKVYIVIHRHIVCIAQH